jgi:hypothetical protein
MPWIRLIAALTASLLILGMIRSPGEFGSLAVIEASREPIAYHIGTYAILTLLVGIALSWRTSFPSRGAAESCLIVVGFGIFDELQQSFVPDRDASVSDLTYDCLGVLVGVLVLGLILRLMSRNTAS